MTTLTVNIPESAKEKMKKYIQRIGGEVVTESKPKRILPIEELEEALSEVKAMENGTIPQRSSRVAIRG